MNIIGFLKDVIASVIPFDNETNGFAADNVQEAIEEIGASASPGFGFGRSGSLNTNTWLRRTGNVNSNRTGVAVDVNNPVITKVAVSNRSAETFQILIYEHEGNENNLTLLGSVNVNNATGGIFAVNIPCTQGRQLAVRLGTTSSGNVRDIGVDLTLSGNN